MARALANSAWPEHFAALAIVLVLLLAGYWSAVVSLAQLWWTSGTYGHGLLVVPISGWLIWRQRHVLAGMAPRASIAGVLAVAGLSAVWFVASAVHLQKANQGVVVALVPMLVWAVLGTRILKTLWFPMVFLFFALPLWGGIVPLLQDLTAYTVYRFLVLLGIPVLLDGYFLNIPSGTFLIEDVCAGLRYFIAGVTVSALFAYLMFTRTRKRVVFFAVAIAVTIAANWLRVLVVVLAGHLTDMQHPLVDSHITLGWVLFGGLALPLFLVAARYRDPPPLPAAQLSPVVSADDTALSARRGVLAFAVAGLTSGPAAVWWMERAGDAADSTPPLTAPHAAGGWVGMGPVHRADSWAPLFKGADASLQRAYRNGDVIVYFYTARYLRQRQGAELINTTNRVYDDTHWRLVPYRQAVVVERGPQWPGRVIETPIVSVTGERRLVWHWYTIGDRTVVRPLRAKLFEIMNMLQGGGPSSVVALAVEHKGDSEQARRTLRAFLDAMKPSPDTDG